MKRLLVFICMFKGHKKHVDWYLVKPHVEFWTCLRCGEDNYR